MPAEITLRNEHRAEALSGYGRVNRGLANHACDSLGNMDAPIHLYASPPYSFEGLLDDRFNVGLTFSDHPLEGYTNFDFAGLSNKMDLILAPSEMDKETFIDGGITTPVEVVPIGHDHEEWVQPIRREENKRVFILDRGRDYKRQVAMAEEFFDDVHVHDCSGYGTLTDAELKELYGQADIFLKWAEEYAWSYPAMEAMSAGCLVISQCPYRFTTLENSLSFQHSKPEQLRYALRSCVEETHIEKKKQAQEDMLLWSWRRSGAAVRQAIFKYYEGKS